MNEACEAASHLSEYAAEDDGSMYFTTIKSLLDTCTKNFTYGNPIPDTAHRSALFIFDDGSTLYLEYEWCSQLVLMISTTSDLCPILGVWSNEQS